MLRHRPVPTILYFETSWRIVFPKSVQTAKPDMEKMTWWRHQMETFSASLSLCAGNSPVTGEFPSQIPVTRSFDVFFDLRLNKRLSKQSPGWWIETSSWSSRSLYDVNLMIFRMTTDEMKDGIIIRGRRERRYQHFCTWISNFQSSRCQMNTREHWNYTMRSLCCSCLAAISCIIGQACMGHSAPPSLSAFTDCSSFIRHLWQSTKHIKWSRKVVHKNNIIRAYNHTTYITRSYSGFQVSCTHVLVVWISSNQFHVSHLGQYCHWCLYMVLLQCQWRKHGWQAHVLTHENTQYL